MNALLLLPVLLPLLAAITSLLARDALRVQRAVAVGAGAAHLASALLLLGAVWRGGVQATSVGNWPAPYGIPFVADLLAAVMVALAALTGLAVAIYSCAAIDARRERFGYYPLLHVLLMGVCGAFLTGDLFNLFVWFEVMLIASFVLLALGGERAQMEGAIKYVVMNLFSSALFLTAVGVLYGVAGSLNMADLAVRLRPGPAAPADPGLVLTVAMLFLVAFGIKAAAFPLFFWLPSSYHTPPAAVSAVFAGLLTKVGVYALIRVFCLIFTQDAAFSHGLILAVAGLTMVTGVLGAVAQNEFRRVLSFHIVSQIGYMLMGLGLFTPLGLAGSLFYIVHHIVVKTALFLISGVAYRLRGTYDLKKLGGLYEERPLLSVLFLVSALSLAGLPPLSGFWAKLVLVRAGLESGAAGAWEGWAIAATSLVVSVLTLFSMTKIWNEAFWKPAPAGPPDGPPRREVGLALMVGPIVMLGAVTVAIGLMAGPVFEFSLRAAGQLLNPAEYIDAVLVQQRGAGA